MFKFNTGIKIVKKREQREEKMIELANEVIQEIFDGMMNGLKNDKSIVSSEVSDICFDLFSHNTPTIVLTCRNQSSHILNLLNDMLKKPLSIDLRARVWWQYDIIMTAVIRDIPENDFIKPWGDIPGHPKGIRILNPWTN